MSFSEAFNYFWVGAILAEFWTNSGGSLAWTKPIQQHLEEKKEQLWRLRENASAILHAW